MAFFPHKSEPIHDEFIVVSGDVFPKDGLFFFCPCTSVSPLRQAEMRQKTANLRQEIQVNGVGTLRVI